MILLDGKIASRAINEDLKQKLEKFQASDNQSPHLAAILIGNNPASETYVASKVKNCEAIGMRSTLIRFDEDVNDQELLKKIQMLNSDDDIDGILVQLPLTKQISEQEIINTISPLKDVDGFHPVNVGKMVLGLPTFISATPYGIMLMLKHYHIETAGKNIAVIGRSNIVGTPISILLSRNNSEGNATVTLCHSKTKNIHEICKKADIIIAAIGKHGFVTAEMVKQGAIVIDVGINRIKDSSKKSGYELTGDVDFKNVAPKCSYITPVPGGVGLMTIAALLMNTYNAFLTRRNIQD
jgi:methylenetetrahydrofolate dehydrogenase (NADP+)/methenyltetrahydrofolate cyclohydrolase